MCILFHPHDSFVVFLPVDILLTDLDSEMWCWNTIRGGRYTAANCFTLPFSCPIFPPSPLLYPSFSLTGSNRIACCGCSLICCEEVSIWLVSKCEKRDRWDICEESCPLSVSFGYFWYVLIASTFVGLKIFLLSFRKFPLCDHQIIGVWWVPSWPWFIWRNHSAKYKERVFIDERFVLSLWPFRLFLIFATQLFSHLRNWMRTYIGMLLRKWKGR